MAESEITFPELDNLPLTARRSLLLSSERGSHITPALNVDVIVKSEDDCFNNLGIVSNSDPLESENTEDLESTRMGCSHVNDFGNIRSQNNALVCYNNAERVTPMEESTESDDALEHFTLKERRQMLLERMDIRLPESSLEDNTKDCDVTDLYEIKAEITCENGIASSSGDRFSCFLEKIDSVLNKAVTITSQSGIQESDTLIDRSLVSSPEASLPDLSSRGYENFPESNIRIAHERSSVLSPKASQPDLSSRVYKHSPLASNGNAATAEKPRNNVKRVKRNHLPVNVSEMQSNQVKFEFLDNCDLVNGDKRNPVTSEQVQVKREMETLDEAHDENELDCAKLSYRLNRCTSAPNPSRFVKTEVETTSELEEDEIDHMKLIDRLKLRSYHGIDHDDRKSPSSGFSFCSSDEYVKPLKILRPWKRKKTATDSIETALEEDAPGLLKALIQQGVSVDELRLYGNDADDGDSSSDSLLEESFSELEDVISQLFIKRETGPKLLSSKFSNVSRTSYCLTCLFSLIEQARYLRFRKWPVEWGWCRDLQSFIFVFERHNRIVMERPEYGYATYFFELSSTASIGWQIKRLILAMKLASCGRYQLIENKPLLVGEDMTEGEAKVLMKFGWVVNTGLGTMLNYCDRVYHDRKTQKQISEWRSKISKLLVDGYNSGTIVATFIEHHDDNDDDVAGHDMGDDVKLEPY